VATSNRYSVMEGSESLEGGQEGGEGVVGMTAREDEEGEE